MENELQTNLDEILLDKETNLLPENLKEGVTVLGVEGSLKVTGSDSNIKLFETVEDMNNDPNPKEDDLAVVYRKEIQPFKEDTETQFITFPEQVILDEPFTSDVYGMLRSVDPSVRFDGQVMLDANMFRFDGYSETGMIRVGYQSEDGKNYTRTEFMTDSEELTNPVDLGTIVEWEPMEPFNDVVGKFMLVGGSVFDGLFKYTTHSSLDNCITLTQGMNYVLYMPEPKLPVQFESIGYRVYITYLIKSVKLKEHYGNIDIYEPNDYAVLYNHNELSGGTGEDVNKLLCDNINCYIGGYSWVEGANSEHINETGLVLEKYENGEMILGQSFTHSQLLQLRKQISNMNGSWEYYVYTLDNLSDYDLNSVGAYCLWCDNASEFNMGTGSSGDNLKYKYNGIFTDLPLNPFDITNIPTYTETVNYQRWNGAPSQFTLSGPNELIAGAIALGKDGTVTGDGSITNATNSFDDIPAMLYSEIQAKYDNMEPVVLTNENHIIENIISNSIYTIPVRSDGTPLLDVSNVTNCYNMFQRCKNLKSIPNLEFNNITNASRMFNVCSNITDINSIDLSNCNNATYMFDNCNKLNTINVTNVENIQNTCAMFGNTNITEANDLNFASATNTVRTFQYCHNITSINNINVMAAGKNISYMFDQCYNLKRVDNFYFNTNNISSVFARAGFESTSDLNIDWSKITSVDNLFYGCNNLYDIYNFSMNNITNVNNLYRNCINIKELPSNYLQDNFPNTIDAYNTFHGCNNLYLENNSFYSNKLYRCDGLFENCTNINDVDNLYIPLCNSVSNMFSGCSNLSSIDNVTFNTLTNCYGMFKNCKSLTEIPNLQYNWITNTVYMFENCMNITTIDKEMNLSNCNCINYMFHSSGLENVDMSKIKFKSTLNSVTSLFKNCAKLTTVTNMNFSGTNVNNYINLFNGCTSLSDNIQIQESNNMYNCFAMFMNCTNFKNIPNINYNNIQYCADWMFYDCTNITTINNLNLSKINSFDYGFANCTNLTTVSNINLYNVNRANSMFKNCTNLTTINNIIFNKINTSLYSAFQGCTNLVNAPNMKINNCINIRNIFLNCVNLVNIPIYNTSKINICLNFVNNCPNLSNDSLNNVLQMCSVMNCTYNLKHIGLTEDQANVCMNLSNYQNFINAGWTTGY